MRAREKKSPSLRCLEHNSHGRTTSWIAPWLSPLSAGAHSRSIQCEWAWLLPWEGRSACELETVLTVSAVGAAAGFGKSHGFKHTGLWFLKEQKAKSITSCRITFCWRPIDATSENNQISVLISACKWLCETLEGNTPLKKKNKKNWNWDHEEEQRWGIRRVLWIVNSIYICKNDSL